MLDSRISQESDSWSVLFGTGARKRSRLIVYRYDAAWSSARKVFKVSVSDDLVGLEWYWQHQDLLSMSYSKRLSRMASAAFGAIEDTTWRPRTVGREPKSTCVWGSYIVLRLHEISLFFLKGKEEKMEKEETMKSCQFDWKASLLQQSATYQAIWYLALDS